MIVKKVKFGKCTKPKAQHIANLVDYIRSPHNVNADEKIAHAGSRNFLTDTHHGQRAEMIALAQESTRSRMPVSHWIFSWGEHEQPTDAQVDELVDIFLQRMGLEGHQVVYGLHHNTSNFHVHIAVNRVHPETLKVITPHKGFDIEEAHKIIALVEQKQGWRSNDNARYAVLENGDIVKRRTTDKKAKPRPKAMDFEHATGEKSAQRIAQERGHSIIAKATSWAELHSGLADVGLRFEKKGSGGIVFVPTAGEDIAVKASSIDRAFSMGKLRKRLGDFEASEYDVDMMAQKKTLPEPVSSVNAEEWEKYQEYAADSRGTAKRRQRFAAWLKEQGLHKQADTWRYRQAYEEAQKARPRRTEVKVAENSPEIQVFERYAAAVDADRFRVTCIKMQTDGRQQAFILDKSNGVTRGFTAKEVVQNMPEMLRLQSRRENVYYTPLSNGKHHIVIDDMTAESVARLRKDGFAPAVILESSPNNYQCILTIRKADSPSLAKWGREASNRLTAELNKRYGDPKLSGCIHPHRAPGFGNMKPKHQRADGSFPRVKLLFAEKQHDDHRSKAYLMAREFAMEFEALEKARQEKEKAAALPSSALSHSALSHRGYGAPTGTPAISAYYAHYENIRKHASFGDLSRIDSMIALRMRTTGHSQEAVREALRQCAPTIRKSDEKGRDWTRYAERTVKYAFGVAGDVTLMKYPKSLEYWKKVEEKEISKQLGVLHNKNRMLK